jgi:hypothetical protein
MNLSSAARSGVAIAMGGLVAASSLGTSVSLTACGESASCSKLRNDTYATKETWDACNPDDQEPCIKVFGNPKDCTGVLACDFAVNPHHRAEAEQSVLTIAEQSQGCYLCAIPNCVGGEQTWCEPVSRRCILVTTLTDGGATSADQPPIGDSGGPAVIQTPGAGLSDATPADM